ncbi:amelotin [Cricetulus griseus]
MHIRSHTGLPGPLAQGNDEIDRLLIDTVLEVSEFHKKHHVNSKDLKKDISITWQQAKEIVRNCPICSFYNQTLLPAGCNPKGLRRNEIWQMDVFHLTEFGNLKYVHHTIDTFSGFQWATALNSEKADSVITHLLEVMAVMDIPAQIKTDNAPAYVSTKMEQFFKYYNIKHCTGIPHNPTGQALVERSNRTLKEMLYRQAVENELQRKSEWKQGISLMMITTAMAQITVANRNMKTTILLFCLLGSTQSLPVFPSISLIPLTQLLTLGSDLQLLNPATGLAHGAQALPFTLGPLNRQQQLQSQMLPIIVAQLGAQPLASQIFTGLLIHPLFPGGILPSSQTGAKPDGQNGVLPTRQAGANPAVQGTTQGHVTTPGVTDDDDYETSTPAGIRRGTHTTEGTTIDTPNKES